MVRNLRYAAVLQWSLLHAGFVHIVLGMYQCFFRDLAFLLLAQICKVHECCTASDLNLILWMMTSISLVSSGISYSERAWSRWCSTVIPRHFLNTAQGLRGESPHFPFCASWQSVCGWCAAQHPIKVSKQDFQSPSGIFITLFQLGSFYWLQRN